MHITVINGATDDTCAAHETALEQAIANRNAAHEIDCFKVREMEIQYCTGCFSCWMKAPGKCVFRDDMERILQSLAKTDFLLFVSPVKAGFITSLAKNVLDRSIPVFLPYTQIIEGECHHPKRYDNPLGIGVMVLDDGNLDAESVGIIFEAFERNALNFHAPGALKRTAAPEEMEAVFDEIISH